MNVLLLVLMSLNKYLVSQSNDTLKAGHIFLGKDRR